MMGPQGASAAPTKFSQIPDEPPVTLINIKQNLNSYFQALVDFCSKSCMQMGKDVFMHVWETSEQLFISLGSSSVFSPLRFEFSSLTLNIES